MLNDTVKTGISELKDKTVDYIKLIDELQIAVPYAESELKSKLYKTSLSVNDLLKELQNYY